MAKFCFWTGMPANSSHYNPGLPIYTQNMLPLSAQFFVSVCVILVVLNVMLGGTAYLILLERKVASWAQDRIGPNRTGFGFGQKKLWDALGLKFMNKFRFLGLGQALADGLKLLFKEDYTPPHTDKFLFTLAPALVMIPAIIGMAVIPWGGEWMFPGINLFGHQLVAACEPGHPVFVAASTLNVGVLYLLAVGSVGVYGVTVGAYASNNKYAFLGGLRATAQMLSYEIPMGLCVLIMILYYKSPDAFAMVAGQTATREFSFHLADFDFTRAWGVLAHPLLAAIFFTCVLAECNRAPFDLAECEQELVGGFHTEYGSMKWAMYFLGEYMHMIVGSAFFTILFLGGSELPFIKLPDAAGWAGIVWVLVKFAILAGKISFLLFAMMWIRWTLPRFRFDQLMRLAWTNLIPMMLLALLVSGVLVVLAREYAWAGSWWAHLGSDVVVVAVSMAAAPFLPKGPAINRKVPLEGSRFCPPAA